jgi:hypothetical protein
VTQLVVIAAEDEGACDVRAISRYADPPTRDEHMT